MPITPVIRVGPMPEPAHAPPAVGFAAGHERIGAVVDVEQGPLRPLQEHDPALVERPVEHQRGVGDVRPEPLGIDGVLLDDRLGVDPAPVVDLGEHLVLLAKRQVELLPQDAGVEQVRGAHAHPADLVPVGRPDPATGRPDLGLAQVALGHDVERPVVGHDQVRVGADEQPVRGDPPGLQPVHLLEEHAGVDDHAVADDRGAVRTEHAARQQVQCVGLGPDDHGVAGVVAALVAHDVVDVAAEEVGGLALALVAPLGAHQDDCRHGALPGREVAAARPPLTAKAPVRLPAAGASCTPRLPDGAGAGGRLPARGRTVPPVPTPGCLLVASAAAGSTDTDALEAARAALPGPVELDTAEDLDAALDRLDGRLLVVAGGDGSIHLAVATLARRGLLGTVVVGLVPLGTGNDLAGGLGLPEDPGEAAARIAAGTDRRLDLLVPDAGDPVVNVVHLGVGAVAADAASALKEHLGPLAYAVGAARAGLTASGWPLHVEVDGEVLADGSEAALMVGIGNGHRIGGGTPLLPGALPDDGLLDVMVSTATGPVERVRYAGALRAGRHLDDPCVRAARGRSVTVRVVGGDPVPVNADGELGDEVTERTWRVEPGAWTLRVLPPRPGGGSPRGRAGSPAGRQPVLRSARAIRSDRSRSSSNCDSRRRVTAGSRTAMTTSSSWCRERWLRFAEPTSEARPSIVMTLVCSIDTCQVQSRTPASVSTSYVASLARRLTRLSACGPGSITSTVTPRSTVAASSSTTVSSGVK